MGLRSGIVFAALVLAAPLAGCAAPKPPISASQGPAVMHYVQGARTPLGVIYLTGSASLGGGERNTGSVPRAAGSTRARAGAAAAEIIHSDAAQDARAAALAQSLAASLAGVQEAVWPGEADPVTARIEVRDRLSDRRSGPHLKHGGAPWRLTFDVEASRLAAPDGQAWLNATLAHELYHLMMIETGWRAATGAPQASRAALEESAASLYGHCANLAAGAPALAEALPAASVRLSGLEGAVTAPFTSEARRAAAAALRRGDAPEDIYFPLNRTLFLHFSGGAGRITPESEEADALLGACRLIGGDPARVLDLLDAIDG